ncbi:MAG: SUMF1/EgtB/PvdO family nonheme iron enzyme [Persicimonas sp.]
MSNTNQVSCPECGTTQDAGAPFCENCGYRIRRSDTVKEGHQAVSSEMLDRVRNKRRATSPARADASKETPRAPTDPPGADGSADMPARSKNSQRPAHGDTDGSEDGSQTYIEGLRSVEDADLQTPADRSVEQPYGGSGSPPGDQAPAPPSAPDSRLPIYLALWLSLTAVAVLATYFLTINAATEDDAPADQPAVAERIDVPAGPFLRGLDDQVRSFILQMCRKVEEDPKKDCKQDKLLKGEYPEETVELDAFSVDSTEVTVGDYESCVDEDACEAIDYKNCEVRTHQGLQISLRVPKSLQEDEVPVSCVDLSQAKSYCKWAGGSLPSADQWEKAARGDKGRLYPWGNSWGSDFANWGERDVAQSPIVGQLDGFERVAPPAQFPDGKSPYGAYDMAGNVAEWVDIGKKLRAHARGGSWTDGPFDLRSTYRMELDADATRTDVGFRCVYPAK